MFVVTEAAGYWIADCKWKWDQYMGGGHTTKKMATLLAGKISKLPSEYFGTNLFVGASTMSKEEIRRRHVLGLDAVMWGTDYPHPEGSWPNTAAKLKADFADVAVEETSATPGWSPPPRCTASISTSLQPVADRIGPTPQDLGQDPVGRPTRRLGVGEVVARRIRDHPDTALDYQALSTWVVSKAFEVDPGG